MRAGCFRVWHLGVTGVLPMDLAYDVEILATSSMSIPRAGTPAQRSSHGERAVIGGDAAAAVMST